MVAHYVCNDTDKGHRERLNRDLTLVLQITTWTRWQAQQLQNILKTGYINKFVLVCDTNFVCSFKVY